MPNVVTYAVPNAVSKLPVVRASWRRLGSSPDGGAVVPVYVPDNLGGRNVTNAGLDVRTLSFPNAKQSVTIRFYEITAL